MSEKLAGGVYDNYYDEECSGITYNSDGFFLNGKPIILLGGAIHYFRVPRPYWRDRLQKIRAIGLNCIDVYVPWNLHEPVEGKYNFLEQEDTLAGQLDLVAFVQEAQKEDLLVLLRPGPYICAELDFGGMPSWLLTKESIRVRTSDSKFLEPAKKYLEQVLSRLSHLTFPKGGPIIGFQIENEYGAFGTGDSPIDRAYLQELYTLAKSHLGSDVFYFTSDTPSYKKDLGAIPGILQMANTQSNTKEELSILRTLQKDCPSMVMEFWSGWFDHWLEDYHNHWNMGEFLSNLSYMISQKASFSFYMVHGGTHFGFLAGANESGDLWPYYAPDVTSYDYDSLVSENGNYTAKYTAAQKLILEVQQLSGVSTPPQPAPPKTKIYSSVSPTKCIKLDRLLPLIPSVKSSKLVAMEDLPINQGNGQSFGYTLYRTKLARISAGDVLTIKGHINDMLVLMVDGLQISDNIESVNDLNKFGSWTTCDSKFVFEQCTSGNSKVLDLLVENCGRVNYGKPDVFTRKKGLLKGSVLFNNEEVQGWEIFPLEMKGRWISRLNEWESYNTDAINCPTMLEADLHIEGEILDTFVDATCYGKGLVYVNGLSLGRFWNAGPQVTLYLPAPFLKTGINKITIFAQYKSSGGPLQFFASPSLGTPCPDGKTPGSGGCLLNLKNVDLRN